MEAFLEDRSRGAGRCMPPQAVSRDRTFDEATKDVRFARGGTLFFDTDGAEFYFEVISGTVRCCRLTRDGRRQIYRFATAGDLLGVSCTEAHGFGAEAVTEVVVRRRRLAGLDAAMAGDDGLRRRVLQALRDELAATRMQMMLLGRMSAREKIASFLLALARTPCDPAARIHLPMTREDIADYLGMTLETVSRKINELHALGVIELESANLVRIRDYDRMEEMADAA